jgi:hypothetical protein
MWAIRQDTCWQNPKILRGVFLREPRYCRHIEFPLLHLQHCNHIATTVAICSHGKEPSTQRSGAKEFLSVTKGTNNLISIQNFKRQSLFITTITNIWIFGGNKTIIINQSNCSHWFYLIVATYFGSNLGPSSGSLTKYVSCYSTVLI